MKIATMARAYLPAPRPADMTHAPIDLAVAIAEGITQQGHELTFYGPNGTHLRATVETLNLPPLAHNLPEFKSLMAEEAKTSHNILGLWDQYMVHEMFKRAQAGQYDLLHLHHPETGLPYAALYPDVPVIYTVHDPIEGHFRDALEMYGSPNQFYVSISNNQRATAPDLPYAATVYNGIDTELFTFSDEPDDYLLFAARITPEKGVREAIQVAQDTSSRLFIIGPVYDDQRDYFETQVKPHLNEKILYLGFIERENMVTYYQKARALLFPVQREEPFGLNMAEAMSCGTPVIGLRRGSIPEIVVHGKTGFIVDSLAEMGAAIKKLGNIHRSDCRTHVEKHFSNAHMVEGYATAFEKTLHLFKSRRRSKAGAR
jgi:glycosyltransferase involved in cell wall biosynthesis